MTAIPQLGEYRLTTAEIIYRMPDHPELLQSFIWQKLDLAPDFPELRRFLEFWSCNIEATLQEQLQQAVANEEYEAAAKLRDALRKRKN